MTQHQIDRKYAHSLFISAVLLVLAVAFVVVWIVGLAINNEKLAVIGACVALPIVVLGFIHTVLARHKYLEESDATNKAE